MPLNLYSDDFLDFWKLTNKKGSKNCAYRAFNQLIKIYKLDEIKNAWFQCQTDKKSSEFQYWPNVSTFLNSGFESYLDRYNDINQPTQPISPSEITAWNKQLLKNNEMEG